MSPVLSSGPVVNLSARIDVAVKLLGEIDRISDTVALCQCPGASMHSGPTGKRDCRITIDGVPTIKCLHSSCSAAVAQANHTLRSEIGKAERTGTAPCTPWRPTPDDLHRAEEKRKHERLAARAQASLPMILRDFATDPVELWEASPTRLTEDSENDWQLFLGLFDEDDRVWIGEVHEANRANRFQKIKNWLKLEHAPATRICPNPFRSSACSRKNEDIAERKFLVVESDVLSKPEICAVFSWLRQILKMVAVVDTGNRSLHGWFTYPATEVLAELKIILPALRCDPALFSPSQPVRLPGALRPETGQTQSLIYLDFSNL